MTAPADRDVAGIARKLTKAFVLQRKADGRWFDAEAFTTEEQALARLRWRQWEAQAEINGRGGHGYTGLRPQQMRVVHLLNEEPQP